MNDWRSQEMAAFKDESNFLAIIDCSPGKYFYKFCVDGVWCHDESQPIIISSKEVTANVINVKIEDSEVFEALACDSFATKIHKFPLSEEWTQSKPSFECNVSPPFLPPHLLSQNVLNKTSLTGSDPVMLPPPSSHVMIQHLYAQSIKDNLLVLSSTTRYKKKCVTVLYYTMIE